MTLLMRTGGVTKIILCADHFYNKIIACFYAIMRMYAPSLEGSRDAFRHELIISPFCSYSYFDVTITAFDGKKAFKPVIVTSKLL